jgi:hypothetical protein
MICAREFFKIKVITNIEYPMSNNDLLGVRYSKFIIRYYNPIYHYLMILNYELTQHTTKNNC